MILIKKKKKKKKPASKCNFFTLPEGNAECRRSSEEFSISQSAQPCDCDETCFLGWRVVWSI